MTRTLLWAFGFLTMATTVTATTNFTLKDQFDRSHTRAEVFKDGPVIMFAGMERKTPDAMEAWDKALRKSAPQGVQIVGLSNLEGVPFFVPKGSIKRTLLKQLPNTVVLCDWKGQVCSSLGFSDGATISVGVFTTSGERLGLVTGDVSDELVQRVLALLPR